jgi:hypothetical protein
MANNDISFVPKLELPENFLDDSDSISEEEYNPFMFNSN